MYLNTELEKSILATNGGQEYDENVKVILAHKIILAHIMNILARQEEHSRTAVIGSGMLF